ncbi:MAG: hypothetical protein PHG27_10870 [Massilibacteroides sp.]|nr:hypothetical protein [Massilibacteroides sp.]MDD3062387.1 hypothetical protein [Massilibacteroides sp.]MDD4116074.1 hypothetical protein [Massilibacteroides sp.]MDD4661203.1 hypothetical protein [Massilibacteroides sp.]
MQKEYIDRGLIALVRSDTSVYIGWRLLKDDPRDIAKLDYTSGHLWFSPGGSIGQRVETPLVLGKLGRE